MKITFDRGYKVKRSELPGTTGVCGRTFSHVGLVERDKRVRARDRLVHPYIKNAMNWVKHAKFGYQVSGTLNGGSRDAWWMSPLPLGRRLAAPPLGPVDMTGERGREAVRAVARSTGEGAIRGGADRVRRDREWFALNP